MLSPEEFGSEVIWRELQQVIFPRHWSTYGCHFFVAALDSRPL